MKHLFFSVLICFFLLSSVACGISWKPNVVDDVNTTLSEYPEAYILSNNIIEVDIFKASAGYNRYYTPDTNEVLIQNERVYVERKVGAAWVPDGVVKNVEIVETTTGYKAIRSHEGVHTFYDVVYVLDDGKPLKFEVNLTAKSEGEYRINWDIRGIMGDNQFVDNGSYMFGNSEDNYKVQIDISDVIEGFGEDYIDVQSSTSVPTGRILDFYFGSFNLGVGENVLVDPVISTSADGAYSVFAIDVDSDGDMDVLSASSTIDKIAWYENNGAESFTEHAISTNADSARTVFAIDVDGDSDIDVLSASMVDDKIAWYENDGAESFTEHAISTNANGAESVYAIDVDGDSDIDVLSASYIDDKIVWYENDGTENFTEHAISTNANGAFSVYAIDVDGDSDIDVLSASILDNKIAWYENNGTENFTEHAISTGANSARTVFAIDVDGDSDIDVLSACYSFGGDKIVWYENNGAESFTEHVISTNARHAHSVYAIDVDGDSDIDVLSASMLDWKIAWYENDGAESFTEHAISTTANNAISVFAIDVDGDSDIDVLSASVIGNEIAWYEHTDFDVRTQYLNDDPLELISVTNPDGDGGFPSGTGYVYFSEIEYSSSLYTLIITGSEQDEGMQVTSNTDIGSVSSIKIQFKTLDSSKSYDIYLDDVYKETAYRSGTHDYTYTESGLQTVKLQETKENIQMSLTNLTSSAINASGVTVADAASQNLISGAATFEPYKYENGIYPINITNSSLADGFNFALTASGLTAAPTTFNGLDSNKHYHVNYDSALHENINGVTNYTFNFTSFSTHTVQLVEYTPVTEEDDEEAPSSASSGLITQPNEDTIEIGELILTKDEFDLLTIEQIEALNVSQDTKDKLIAIKSINVDWWKIVLGLCLMAAVIEGSRKEGNEVILVVGVVSGIIGIHILSTI